jgi:ribosomal protein S18 acetylase RimI-like enzyme
MDLRPATPDDLPALAALEAASYPPDEAASQERFAERLEAAPECFWLAEEDGALVGFVCGTRAAEATLTHASMAAHAPAGPSLCIHSVVVAAARRRAGLGTRLVEGYLGRTADLPGLERWLLICKEHLIGFYAANGFERVGPSTVVHGQDPWFEMRRERAR